MATNENNTDPQNESSSPDDSSSPLPSEHEQAPGLTADEAAERSYSEADAWNKNKTGLFALFGIILLVVAGYMYFEGERETQISERSSSFLKASSEEDGSEDRFLSFAKDHPDKLGGVALYRAAVIQYRANNFSAAAKSFENAATTLMDDPLLGRALIGQAVSLLKSDNTSSTGHDLLKSVTTNTSLLPADRSEAHFLLGVQALSRGDEKAFATEIDILAEDLNASYFHSRLAELSKTRKLFASAESLADLNVEKGKIFLSKNKENEGIETLESGLQYKILSKGTGPSPLADDEVEVHYHGTLLNGQVFDSSIQREEPAKFNVSGVIKGWTEALQLMKVGGKWKVFIPSDLAYAESGNNSIGPNETLIFEVELLGITSKPSPPDLTESNTTDSNTSSAEAPVVLPQGTGDAIPTTPIPVVERNDSE
jgi:FKBP-type peptidyl-prolyl cis-trans isomerase FklB